MKIMKNEGFSMLEVMIGLIIFSIGLLMLSSMTMVALSGNKWSSETTQIVQLTRQKIEEFKNENPVNMVSGSEDLGKFTRTWIFNDVSLNLKGLTVIIEYTDRFEVLRACSTSTYFQVN